MIVVVSQDCDVVHRSFEAEPFVEVLVAREITAPEKKESLLFHGKNPRRVQFQVDTRSGQSLYEINICEKCTLDRRLLLDKEPDSTVALEANTIRMLANWVAKRYTRAGFPDAFNSRCKRLLSQIPKVQRADGHLITGIFLRLSTDQELPSNENYQVILRATAPPEVLRDPEQEKACMKLVDAIAEALDGCEGVQVLDHELVSEEDFSLVDLRETMRWDFEFLSFSDGTAEAIAPS